jgi:multiple sugar transport system substrate-binding protein
MKVRPIVSGAVVVLAFSLAACSGGAQNGGGGDVTELSLQDYYASATPESAISRVYDQCATELGVDLKVEHVAPGGYVAKLLQQSSSKTLPDVLMLDNPTVQQIAASGALAPLGDFDITGDGVAPGVVSAASYEGELYAAIPIANSLALFYNKDVFDEAGLTPPTSWDELAETAKALTEGDRYGIAFSGAASAEGTFQLLPFMWSNGGDEADLDTPENAEALKFVSGLVRDGSASQSVTVWGMGDVNNAFIAGQAAMMINGPWNIPALKATEGLNWDYVQIPTRTADQVSQGPLGGEGFAVPNTGDEARMALAAQFVACINSPENEILIATEAFAVPTNMEAAATFAGQDPTFATFVEIVADARSRTAQLGAEWPAAEAEIYTAEQLALTGKASPEDAFAEAANQ